MRETSASRDNQLCDLLPSLRKARCHQDTVLQGTRSALHVCQGLIEKSEIRFESNPLEYGCREQELGVHSWPKPLVINATTELKHAEAPPKATIWGDPGRTAGWIICVSTTRLARPCAGAMVPHSRSMARVHTRTQIDMPMSTLTASFLLHFENSWTGFTLSIRRNLNRFI